MVCRRGRPRHGNGDTGAADLVNVNSAACFRDSGPRHCDIKPDTDSDDTYRFAIPFANARANRQRDTHAISTSSVADT